MADKPTKGQLPPTDNVDEPTPEPTEAPLEPTEEPVGENLPDKFKGKTAEEIAQAYQELEKVLGEKSTRTSELESELAFNRQFNPQGKQPDPYQTPYGSVNQEQPPEPAPPVSETQGLKDEFGNWTEDGLRKVFRGEMASMGNEWQQRQGQVSQAIGQARPIMEQAQKESPNAFDGVSLQEVGQAVQSAMLNGMPVNLNNPETYKDAALLMKAKKTNYGTSQSSANIPEETPPFTETPGGTEAPEPAKRPVIYEDEARAQEIMKGFKLTKEQADEIMRKYGDPGGK